MGLTHSTGEARNCERQMGRKPKGGVQPSTKPPIVLHREVDDGWIFLDKKVVLRESFNVQDEVVWKVLELERLHDGVLVRLVLLSFPTKQRGRQSASGWRIDGRGAWQ